MSNNTQELSFSELNAVSGGITWSPVKMASDVFLSNGAQLSVGTTTVTTGGVSIDVPYVRYQPPWPL